jgi:hypothetical protein
MTDDPPASPLSAPRHPVQPGRVSLIRSFFSLLSFDTLPKFKATRKDTSEGILAPRSPLPPPRPLSPVPIRSLSPVPYPGAPPRSPLLARAQEIEVGHAHLSPSTNFSLRTPPRRSTVEHPGLRRSATGDGSGLGLGLRRTSSFNVSDEQ